ncbi:MAG TPA: uroporphyrinogen-III C-methyltransferase [Acidimicrobiales bacterium]|nr:uroporphyrinogen-III C-methyltransferase [Acidimicrobiales bacterium]
MTVYLVGAGPGDPSLLTLRAAELIGSAGAIVHDRLVDAGVLALAPPEAVLYDVGKRPGRPGRQDEIDELLVELAGRHERVVRLKGGDPFVFGRGGEEALALSRAGVPFEVVPGVSSVNGALAYAGIPLTHRGLAASFTVVTGHDAGEEPAEGGSVETGSVDWEALSRVGGTLVVLMGVARRREIAERLLAAGREPSTPVAVVEQGTRSRQRTWRTTLAELGSTMPGTPALIVVGEVAALELGWFESRPLFGWRVVVTRAREQASALAALLRAAGAEPVEVPTIEIGPAADGGLSLRQGLERLRSGGVDWVAFSSANAVERLFELLHDARELAGVKVAAIGPATAAALRKRGIEADLVPPAAVAEELAAAFPPGDPDARRPVVFLPQAAGAREELAAGLGERGYEVVVAEAYRTVNPPASEELAASLRGADAVTFSSSSTVEGFVAAYGTRALPPLVVTIGPVTSNAARELGVRVDAEAAEASVAGLVEALVRLAHERGRPARS